MPDAAGMVISTPRMNSPASPIWIADELEREDAEGEDRWQILYIFYVLGGRSDHSDRRSVSREQGPQLGPAAVAVHGAGEQAERGPRKEERRPCRIPRPGERG